MIIWGFQKIMTPRKWVGGWLDCFQRVINQFGTLENLQNDTNIMKFGQIMTDIGALAMFWDPKKMIP